MAINGTDSIPSLSVTQELLLHRVASRRVASHVV